jgi:hypothetical protein
MSKKEEVFEIPEKSDDAMNIPVDAPKPPRKKREMTDEAKVKMLENLRKGREAKKAKLELAKASKVVDAPKETPKVAEAPKVVAKKPKPEPVIDLEAENARISLINKIVGKEKTKPVKRQEPALSETTKEAMKAERKVKVIEAPKETPKPVSAPQVVVAPVAVKPDAPARIVKSTFKKPIW